MSAEPSTERRRPDATTRTLGLLVLLTMTSFVLMETTGGSTIAALIVLVAFVKVALIGARFMELHAAPVVLRAAFGTWTIGTGALLAILLHT
jgi:hypothetical protein